MFSSRRETFDAAASLDGFAENGDYLRAEIDWLRCLIRCEIEEANKQAGAPVADEFAGLYVSPEQVERHLTEQRPGRDRRAGERAPRHGAADLSDMRASLDRRISLAEANGVELRLPLVARTFGLNDVERAALLCCLAAELDIGMSRLFAYLQDDATKKRPTFGLLSRLATQNDVDPIGVREIFAPSSPLFRCRLIESPSDTLDVPFPAVEARLASGLTDFLVGSGRLPAALADAAEVIVAGDQLDKRAYYRQHRAIIEELLRYRLSKGILPLCYISGPEGAGKAHLASTWAAEIGKNVLRVSATKLLAGGAGIENLSNLLAREAHLRKCIILLEDIDELGDDAEREKAKIQNVEITLHALTGCDVIATGAAPVADLRHRLRPRPLTFELAYPTPGEAVELWQNLLKPHLGPQSAVDIAALGNKFRFTPGQIERAIDAAVAAAPKDTAGRAVVSSAALHGRCRDEAERSLHTFCHKIVPRHGWTDIVLPGDTFAQLKEICRWAKHRSQVYEEWGFGPSTGPIQGLAVLLSGASGTGKTMSAEIIANDLELDLFRIDLSRIVSKYIGETEKNLSRIFSQSASNNCVLFFDEADALFGKRTEVKDAHDRYANIEINYLLTEIERYQGVIVVATNMKGNVDPAFIRRFSHVVEYPMPNERLRESIWKKSFPAKTPLAADVDFAFLAQNFDLSGGNIKNIALSSAFLASAEGGEITMGHVILATKREYQKIGRVCSKSDFGPHYALVRERDAP